MKKLFVAVFAVFIATVAFATTTWTSVSTGQSHARAVKGANPTASGTDPAPVTSTTSSDGLNLVDLKSFTICVETTTGGNLTAGGKLLAYVQLPGMSGKWGPVSDGSLDLTVAAVPVQCFPGFTVTNDLGRIAYEPSGLGTTTNVYIEGASKTGGPPRTAY